MRGGPSADQRDAYRVLLLLRLVFVMAVGRVDILQRLVEEATPEETAQRLASVCADVTGVPSAAIVLMDDDVALGVLPATDPIAARIARLQHDRRDGPVVDAYRLGRPVYEPELLAPHVATKWPVFQPAALELGIRAAFAVPLQVGTCRLGAISLQSDRSRALTQAQQTAALTMAAIAAQAILVLKAGPPLGRLVSELRSNAEYDVEVNQAAGMVSSQLHGSVAHALIQMRAHAFSNDTTLIETARQVLARTIRFNGNGTALA
jgi:hypothetical protein